MPVYNCKQFVGEAIQSILDQTFGDFELIIIDDRSTDGTSSEIRNYNDPRIRLVEKKENTGLIDSLNMGISLSRGEFIARMDGDDTCNIHRFYKQVDYLKANPDVVLCGAWYQRHSTKEVVRFPLTHEGIKFALLDYCSLCHPTIMVRTQFVKDNQLRYDPDFKAAEDYELWTRIVSLGQVANLPEVLIDYRTHENQVSNAFNAEQSSNSYRCMAKMMRSVIAAPSNYDEVMSLAVVKGDPIKSLKQLKEVIQWLNGLIMANNATLFYSRKDFKKNVANRKLYITRRFYLSTSPHNPKTLFETLNNGLLRSLTFTEFSKYAIKCLFSLK